MQRIKSYTPSQKVIAAVIGVALLTTAATVFMQSSFGRVILNCYAPFTISATDGGTQIDCPQGEVIALVTATSTPASTATKTNTPPIGTPTSAATAPKTNTPGSGRTPTATLAKTNTPAPTLPGATSTATKPAGTPTPGATVTPTSSVSPTPDPDAIFMADDGCMVANTYHPVMPGVVCKQFSTGANMRDPANQALFDTYAYPGMVDEILDKYGEVRQPLFVSNAQELPHHWRAFRWHIDKNEGCDQFEGGTQDYSGWACLVYTASRLHDDGTIEHMLSRYHSAFFIWTVCGKGSDGVWQKSDINPAQCAVFYGPQLMDFCDHHLAYKKEWNPIPGTDSPAFSYPSMPPNIKDGGCYKTSVKEDRNKPIIGGWWGQPSEAIDAPAYPHDPNAGFAITWLSNMWHLYSPLILNLPLEDQKAYARTIPPDEFGGNWSYKVMNARMQFEVPGPGTYWVDQWGHPKVNCTTITDTCHPLVVVGNPPLQPNGLTLHAILARRFDFGEDCLEYYCIKYAEPGDEVFPGYDNPTGAPVEHHP